MSEDIREEIARTVRETMWKREWHVPPSVRFAVADALMPLVARIQADAWDAGWAVGFRDSKRAAAIALGAPKTPNPHRVDSQEQG